MLLWPDCIPCILKMSLEAGRLTIKDESKIKDFISIVSNLKPLCGNNWQITAGEVVRDVWYILTEFTGNQDPMKELKADLNNRALEIYPYAKELILKSTDPFTTALKFSIAANALDIMVSMGNNKAERIIPVLEGFALSMKNVETLRERLGKARKLVFLSDNCGEIVFDRLLLEVLRRIYDLDITVVTRTLPVLNDATLQDTLSAGLGEEVEVIENGILEPLAGTILAKVSPQVRSLVEKTDLLISKGGANYDCLTEEPTVEGKVTYLLHGKCYPYCFENNVSMGTLIVRNS